MAWQGQCSRLDRMSRGAIDLRLRHREEPAGVPARPLGRPNVGAMSVSIRDVAERAGVSVGTVSNVLNRPEKVSPGTREKVQRAISELGFVRNDAARQLRAGSSRTIGLIVLDVGNPFFTDLARGAEDFAAEQDHLIIVGSSEESASRESAYIDLFQQQRVRGVLISPVGDVGARLTALRELGISAVLIERPDEGGGFPSISVDNVAGGYLAVKHLIEQGCRRIAYVASQFEIRQVKDRLEGARRAVAETPGAILEVTTAHGLTVIDGRDAGESIIARDPSARPDGIFAVNDLLAFGLLQSFVFMGGIRVPDDIAIVGYDDIGFAQAAVVPLSSVRQPSYEIGRTAVEFLLDDDAALDQRLRSVVFQPELIVRASSTRRSQLATEGNTD